MYLFGDEREKWKYRNNKTPKKARISSFLVTRRLVHFNIKPDETGL